MFHDIYTYKNNHPGPLFSFTDPFNLRNCIRIYSHENNSDCFFIAVIHKKKDFEKKHPINKNNYSIPLNEKKMKTIGEDLDDFIDFLGLEKESKNEDDNNNNNDNDIKINNKNKVDIQNLNDINEKDITINKEKEKLIFYKICKYNTI